MLITEQRLREVLRYDQSTGQFFWLVRRGAHPAGSLATRRNRSGYLRAVIDGRDYLLHRLAWLYVHGKWPSHEIDHINGVRSDNRIANLRDVTRAVNQQNRRRPTIGNTSSGLLGAHYKKSKGRFDAQISVNGKDIHLGCYRTAEEAHSAYLAAKRRLHVGCTI